MSLDQQKANKKLMEKAARAYAKDDLGPLIAALDENVVWKSNSPVQLFRFGGEHFRAEGVKEHQSLMATTYLFHRFEPKLLTAEGESVWGIFDVEATHQPTRNRVRIDLAIHWIVRDGKVVSHQGFFDTASLLIQQGQLTLRETA